MRLFLRLSIPCPPVSLFLLSLALILSGCGGSSTSTTTIPSTPAITFSASSLSFASTTMGSSSASQTVTVSSTGSATLAISSVTLSDTTDYALTSNCSGTFGPGTSCSLAVTFTPKSAASLPATLSIADNVTGSPQTIALTGSGVAVPAPVLTLSANSLTFSSTPVGSTGSVTGPITLTNSGNAPLTLSSIVLSDTKNFTLASTCTATLAAGARCGLSFSFTPQSSGNLSASVTIADNAAPSTAVITLSGNATAPAVTLSPTSIAFPSTVVGSTSAVSTITLTNSGNAPLYIFNINFTDTVPNNFIVNKTCGTTVAAGASCTISATFTPTAAQTFNSTISVVDNAPGSAQTVTITGTGTAPAATLSASSIALPSTTVGSTSAASSITLTNSGTAALTIGSITLGGTNPADFAETTTCGATLAAAASCTISATFTPAAAQSYAATITVTDNAAGSPQTIVLTGTGAAATPVVTRTLYTFPESDNSVTPLYALVNSATKTIDMTMYELQDTTFDNDLIAACARGVRVRVILSSSEKSNNTPAYTALNTASSTSATAGANCSAVLSNTAFTNTHQKTITIDNATTAIMTLNLQSQYYSTTRDFALVENDTADIAAIEATFAADYAAGTPYGGTQGASDFSYKPAAGDDLIWSPTTAQASMESIINNAKSTLLIENEELASSASYIVNDLAAACQRGVVVHFTIVYSSSYAAQLTTIKNAGCSVHTYANTTTGFYVHAKVVVADYGASTQNVYLGSINYSNASMNLNRELGLFLSDNAVVQTLYTTLNADYAGGTVY